MADFKESARSSGAAAASNGAVAAPVYKPAPLQEAANAGFLKALEAQREQAARDQKRDKK